MIGAKEVTALTNLYSFRSGIKTLRNARGAVYEPLFAVRDDLHWLSPVFAYGVARYFHLCLPEASEWPTLLTTREQGGTSGGTLKRFVDVIGRIARWAENTLKHYYITVSTKYVVSFPSCLKELQMLREGVIEDTSHELSRTLRISVLERKSRLLERTDSVVRFLKTLLDFADFSTALYVQLNEFYCSEKCYTQSMCAQSSDGRQQCRVEQHSWRCATCIVWVGGETWRASWRWQVSSWHCAARC